MIWYAAITWLSRLSPLAWAAAVVAAFTLPVRLVVVIAAAAMACTGAVAVRAVHDDCIDRLVDALLSTRPTPGSRAGS